MDLELTNKVGAMLHSAYRFEDSPTVEERAKEPEKSKGTISLSVIEKLVTALHDAEEERYVIFKKDLSSDLVLHE